MSNRPGSHEVMLSLTATTSPSDIGGYHVSETENYNGGYLAPVVELNPGDNFRIRLVNALTEIFGGSPSAAHAGHAPQSTPVGSGGAMEEGESTNLHTHGLIVSPKNLNPAQAQNGDNIFVSLRRGESLDYDIHIPIELPASLLDGKRGTFIPHPSGPFWYHAHQHGVSAVQVAGGMSGLLSIGPRDINLVAAKPGDTAALRARTDVAYLMLRDIQITSATDPKDATGHAAATWVRKPDPRMCEPSAGSALSPPVQARDGFCQNPQDNSRIWLFTVNGQRFPTIRILPGRANLWRVANVSASATYKISLREAAGSAVPFDVVTVDGVVPGSPEDASTQSSDNPQAIRVADLLLMPAARAEIFIANDNRDPTERHLVLRTDGIDTSAPGSSDGDRWPQINLAQLILEGTPAVVASAVPIGLNRYIARPGPPELLAQRAPAVAPSLPPGCVRDINKADLEHRRIWFVHPDAWGITTEIVHPKDKTRLQPYTEFEPDPAASLNFVSFDRYIKPDHTVDWEGIGNGSDPNVRPRHTCVRLSNGHGQLWELSNPSSELHNFHLHQSKFRLATEQDLRDYGIDPSGISLPSGLQIKSSMSLPGSAERNVWHDTLPVPANETIFIVINFDAEEQLGRYVFHCHILEHEDHGLMAPIEVIR